MITINSSSNIIMFVLFGLLIALMIGIALFGSYKERNRKRIELTTTRSSNLSVEDFYITSMFKLEKTVLELEHDLATFKPSVGKKTMHQISKDAHDVVMNIEHDSNYANIKKSEKYGSILTDIINELKHTKPTKWDRHSYSSLNIIKAKASAYKNKNKVLYEKFLKDNK